MLPAQPPPIHPPTLHKRTTSPPGPAAALTKDRSRSPRTARAAGTSPVSLVLPAPCALFSTCLPAECLTLSFQPDVVPFLFQSVIGLTDYNRRQASGGRNGLKIVEEDALAHPLASDGGTLCLARQASNASTCSWQRGGMTGGPASGCRPLLTPAHASRASTAAAQGQQGVGYEREPTAAAHVLAGSAALARAGHSLSSGHACLKRHQPCWGREQQGTSSQDSCGAVPGRQHRHVCRATPQSTHRRSLQVGAHNVRLPRVLPLAVRQRIQHSSAGCHGGAS